MNKVKLSWSKHSLVTVLSLGFIILGIGFITWSMLNIWNQSRNELDTTHSSYSAPITQNKLKEVGTAQLESELSSPNLNPDKALYPVYPVEGNNIGSLMIPALNRKLPIFEGTGDKELNKGVGHFIQSVLPGEEDNCVFSGHRETAFIQIGKLKIGDKLIVQTSAGTFTYEVNGTRIVHADDKTVIVPTDHAVLTMTTCYPFNFIGNAPDRYIVSASLLKSK